MPKSKDKILETLLYFDLFNYPLTEKEIKQFITKKIAKEKFDKLLSKVRQKDGLYFIKGREKIVSLRKKRNKESKSKITKATKYSRILANIPTVKLIGISGSLSMGNSEREDDIDIFIISAKGFVWLTRLFCVVVLKLYGVYRKNNDTNIKDKLCLNLIIGEDNLKFAKKQRNLYTAHEIVQLLPIFQRDNMHRAFIEENEWISNFLPSYKERILEYTIPINTKTTVFEKFILKILKILYLENIVRFAQYFYMKPKITTEKIKDNMLAFHPNNYEKIVLKKTRLGFSKRY